MDENKENRIEFNEVSQKAIQKALEHPRKINYNLVDAQQARRVLDRLVGYKLSTLLNHKIEDTDGSAKRSLSGGRVQSVALRLIVEREREIQAFKPEEYWNLTAELQDRPKAYSPFKALLEKKGTKKYKPSSAEEAEKVLKELENGEYVVSKVKKAVAKSHAPAPFTTSSMQQDASNKLGFSSPETMSLAQHLYEGIETENGDHLAFITYMRTDSVRISAEAQQNALARIRAVYGEEYAPEKPNYYATKKGAQDAHEAVRPIDLEMTPEKAKKLLDRKHFALYKLIYERFLASQMAEAKYNSTQMEIDNSGYVFKASGRVLLFAGYTKVYEDVAAPKKRTKRASRRPSSCLTSKRGISSTSFPCRRNRSLQNLPFAIPTLPSSKPWKKRGSAAPLPTRPLFPNSIRSTSKRTANTWSPRPSLTTSWICW